MRAYNPYQALDIARDSSLQEIKRAYRKKAFETHPDREGGSNEEFIRVSEAYRILSDEKLRHQFDERGDISGPERSYQDSYNDFLSYLAEEASVLILHGKSTQGVRDWLKGQGCPDSIIIEFEKFLRKGVVSQTRREGVKFALLHLFLFFGSIGLLFVLFDIKWLGALLTIIFFFWYWPRAIPFILTGLGAAIFGKHPASWSQMTLRIVGYSPLIILVMLYLLAKTSMK